MDDKERFTAWLEIEEKYRLLEEEWRNNRRGINANTPRSTESGTEAEIGGGAETPGGGPRVSDTVNPPAPTTAD